MSRLSIPHRANKLGWLLEDFAEFSRVNFPRADYLAEESPGLAFDLRGRQTEVRGGTCFSLECALWRRRGRRSLRSLE